MKSSRVERFAQKLDSKVQIAVRNATSSVHARSDAMLTTIWSFDALAARIFAAAAKDAVIDALPDYLDQFEREATSKGARVHRAIDAAAACAIILDIVGQNASPGATIVKGKSMATEEIHLNAALESAGYRPVETDLGEFVVQLDGDTPSHIVAPIIHKSRQDVGRTFSQNDLGPPTDDPAALTEQARVHLRAEFQRAEIGISGANFLAADTGRVVIVENEGNNRLSTTAPNVHIVVAGIEKLIAKESELNLFFRLLAASSTGQRITTYTHFVSGPRRADELDGPDEVHIVLLDNGRLRISQGPYRAALRCIRCGACLNVCPVYRQASGHGYGHVYSGPIGAVLAPALEGVAAMGDLAFASTLCGACESVCPVRIPIPDLLLKLRNEATANAPADPVWTAFGAMTQNARRWNAALKALPLVSGIPMPTLSGWTDTRDVPQRVGRDFRSWFARYEPAPAHGSRRRLPESPDPPEELAFSGCIIEIPEGVPTDKERFEERFVAEGGRVATMADLATLAGRPALIDADARGCTPKALLDGETSDVWAAEVGVTRVDAAIIETGTFAIGNLPGRRRMASLSPEIHVALVRESDCFETIEAAMTKLTERSAAWITGPSRTADIEGTLVRGVHGPREVWLVWLD